MTAPRASLSTHSGALVAQKDWHFFLAYLETEVAGPFAFPRDA